MIHLEPQDVVLVASRVLGRPADETLRHADLALIARILHRARGASRGRSGGDELAAAAGTLLVEFVRLAPFGDATAAVAFACALHLASVNDRDLDLGPPEAVKQRLTHLRAGPSSADEVVEWLRGGIVRRPGARKEPIVQRRRRRESEAHLNRTWERFTERAKRSVDAAHDEAAALGDREVAPEHLVLGMLRVPESIGAKAMADLGVTLDAVRGDLGRSRESPAPGRPRMTPQTKWVLQLAVKEAMQLDADHIGTEHILLALTHLPVLCGASPGGSRLLPGLGLTMGRIRTEVFRLLTGSPSSGGDGPDRDAVLGRIREVFADNERLRSEVDRLRAILEARGIRPDGGDAETA